MKILILNESKQGLGGGWSFIRNLEKGFYQNEVGDSKLISNIPAPDVYQPAILDMADIIFIPSASMVQRDTVIEAKRMGKKIVLRVDNVPRNSRNRGTGTTRLFDIAQLADKVIYQSEWARDYLKDFLLKDGQVIYNGIDTDIFKEDGPKVGFRNDPFTLVYLYSRYNRDETKGWERAWFDFQQIHKEAKLENKKVKLVLVGQFSEELRAYNFDFFMGEHVEYLGVIDDPEYMAQIYRGCDVLIAPYFNDCYSNTIQEAMACDLLIRVDHSGGTPELVENGVITAQKMAQEYIGVFNELI